MRQKNLFGNLKEKNKVLNLNSRAMTLWMRLIVFVLYSDIQGKEPLKNVRCRS